MDNHTYALIMAGGQGTRFWPWSTPQKPKQFLPVVGNEALLTQTHRRLAAFIPPERILIIADPVYLPAVREALPGFTDVSFIPEPAPRNTAPALILANIHISRIDPDARLLVVPADHYIRDVDTFARQFSAALEQVRAPVIVTAGIPPTSPHTGYGYICSRGGEVRETDGVKLYAVESFREKPDLETAREYCQKGNYFWNSGMFVYHVAHFRRFLESYNPYYFDQYQIWEKSFTATDRLRESFLVVKPDSIDYALMEKVRETLMFEAAFDWNDVGSWTSVYEINQADENGNVVSGRPLLLDTRDSLVFSVQDIPLAVIGLENIAVIQTDHGILVAPLDQLQRVKEVSAQLREG